jgi:hypothetical protein
MSAAGKLGEMGWSGWKQSIGPQTKLDASESAYWGKKGEELLASAGPEPSSEPLSAAPFSVIIVESNDHTLHFEFLQMISLASSGMWFRAKTPDGWRSKNVEGPAWEVLLKAAAQSGSATPAPKPPGA